MGAEAQQEETTLQGGLGSKVEPSLGTWTLCLGQTPSPGAFWFAAPCPTLTLLGYYVVLRAYSLSLLSLKPLQGPGGNRGSEMALPD